MLLVEAVLLKEGVDENEGLCEAVPEKVADALSLEVPVAACDTVLLWVFVTACVAVWLWVAVWLADGGIGTSATPFIQLYVPTLRIDAAV